MECYWRSVNMLNNILYWRILAWFSSGKEIFYWIFCFKRKILLQNDKKGLYCLGLLWRWLFHFHACKKFLVVLWEAFDKIFLWKKIVLEILSNWKKFYIEKFLSFFRLQQIEDPALGYLNECLKNLVALKIVKIGFRG